MKKLLVAGLSSVLLVGCATTTVSATPERLTEYQRIVDIPNATQDMIYEGSRQWFAKRFTSANSVIQYHDKSTGSIIGKGNIAYPCQGLECIASFKQSVHFTVKVDSKDGRARITFDDLKMHTTYSSGDKTEYHVNGKKEADNVKVILDKAINTFAEDVSSATKNNDW